MTSNYFLKYLSPCPDNIENKKEDKLNYARVGFSRDWLSGQQAFSYHGVFIWEYVAAPVEDKSFFMQIYRGGFKI